MVAHAPTAIGRHRRRYAVTVHPPAALAALVVSGFVFRVALVLGREVQRYLPDEYLYGQLARSLAEGRGARVLGEQVGLPTLLQPILTAPAWLAGDPELAFRLTQGANAGAMSLGAIIVYLLARELGVPAWSAVGAAAVALASPDLLYAGYVTADALGYLLALLAILAAVRALARPSLGLQASFVATAGLATFARAQYAALFLAAAVAAVVVERGRPRRVVSRHGLLVATPLLAAVVFVGTGRLGRYATLASFDVAPDALGWLPPSAFLLAVAAGAVIVPGAVAWTLHELARPHDRLSSVFAALAASLVGTLLVASSLLSGETGSDRFLERYLIVGPPLAAVAFTCWLTEARPWRYAVLGTAAVLALAAARVPLSEYAAGQGRADSPLLLAVGQLEGAVGVGNASLLTALGVSACMALAAAAAFGRVGGRGTLVTTIAALALVSVGAHAADRSLSHEVRRAKLGAVAGWVDRTHAADVLLVQTAGGDPAGAMLLTLHNTSVTGAALLGPGATPFDGAVRRLEAGADGTLRLGGQPVRRPLLLVDTSTRVVPANASLVEQAGDFVLVRPRGNARAAVVVEGLYHDGWLGDTGSITVYATGRPSVCRRATLQLTLPAGVPATRLTAGEGAAKRIVTVRAGRATTMAFDAGQTTASFRFRASAPRVVADPTLRALSARALVTSVTRACSSG